MMNKKLAFALSASLCVTAAFGITPFLLSSSSFGQDGKKDNSLEQQRKYELLEPVAVAVEPTNLKEKAAREAKNCRYNSVNAEELLTEQPDGVQYGKIEESPRPPAMPVAQSGVIVLGKVIKLQSYLTEKRPAFTPSTQFKSRKYLRVSQTRICQLEMSSSQTAKEGH